MRITKKRRLVLALSLGALWLSAPATAEDADLFGGSAVSPNVLIGMDTSGSMQEVMYPPAFDPADSTCAIFKYFAPNGSAWQSSMSGSGDKNDQNSKKIYWKCDSNTRHCRFEIDQNHANFVQTGTYTCPGGGTAKEGYIERRLCGNTRRLYVDPRSYCTGGETWHSEQWLEWYFSDAADPYVIWNENNTSTDPNMIDANRNGVDAWDGTSHAAYKRSRMTAALQVAREVIFRTNTDCAAGTGPTCTDYLDRVRFGLAEFGRDKKAGYISSPIDDYSNNRADLENTLRHMVHDDSTPTAEAIFRWYTYFMSRSSSYLAKGKNNSTKFPVYKYNTTNGDVQSSSTHSSVPPQPVTAACQKNFLIFISDGDPNGDDFSDSGSRAEGFSDFKSKLIGDYYRPGGVADEVEEGCPYPPGPPNCGKKGTRYPDDITYFMNTRDFAPDLDGEQTIDTYTVAFNVSASSEGGRLLANTAVRGGGTAYFGEQADELAKALTDAITDIIEKSAKSFASPSVPASRLSVGDNFYSTYFEPSTTDPLWSGHLKAFQIDAAGNLLDASGYCLNATVANDPPPCASTGTLRHDVAPDFWDAADEVPAPTSRNLYYGAESAVAYARPPAWTKGNVDAAELGITAADLGVTPHHMASNPEQLADFTVDFFRGCEFGTSCTPRNTLLGDIFHSDPVVVGQPNSPINEASYATFSKNMRTRDRVIYAGANDGFLHAFHAGVWDTSLTPDRYNRGTGIELFGFMPWTVANHAKKLAPNSTVPHTFYGPDGPVTVADVWLYRDFDVSASPLLPTATADDKKENQWRTVLIGGLRQGGGGYYALDITDPSSGSYPGYMWEIPCEGTNCPLTHGTEWTSDGRKRRIGNLGTDQNSGMSQPVITRVRVKSDTGTDERGYERWVAIFGGGYHEWGDPNHPSYEWGATGSNKLFGRAIFMVDITTGKLLAWKTYTETAVSVNGSQYGFPEMHYAFASAPAVFDLDFDGFADVIYIGDLGGNLWKWVVKDLGDDPINNSGTHDNIAQPSWPFRLFFRGSASTEPPPNHASPPADSAGVHFQSFFYPPTGVLRNGNLVLGLGSGQREDLTAFENDGSTNNNNHYYVLVDSNPLEKGNSPPHPITGSVTESDLANNATTNAASCNDLKSNYKGYFIDGRDGEKFISASTVFMGDLYTGSHLATDPALNSCNLSGKGYLYRFTLDCGVGRYTNPGGPDERRRTEIGVGLPSRPRVSVGGLGGGGGGGCNTKVTIVTSDGGISHDCPGPVPGGGTKLRSWRAQ